MTNEYPDVHIFGFPTEVKDAAKDDQVRDGAVVMAPLWNMIGVKIGGRIRFIAGGDRDNLVSLAEMALSTYANSFAIAYDEIRRRPEFGAPQEVQNNGLGWTRLVVAEHTLQPGDYVLTSGLWLSVAGCTVTEIEPGLLRVATMLHLALDEARQYVRMVNTADEEEFHLAVWRPLPVTVLSPNWSLPTL